MPKFLFRAIAIIALATASLTSPVVAQKAEKAPPAVQAEFNAFIGSFRAALKANDSAAVTTMTRTPFYYDDKMLDAA